MKKFLRVVSFILGLTLSSCFSNKGGNYSEVNEEFEPENTLDVLPFPRCEGHHLDNGDFTFKYGNNSKCYLGEWKYKCTDSGCNFEYKVEGNMFRPGSTSYGYEQLGKIPEFGAELQECYRELLLECEEMIDDFETNFVDYNIDNSDVERDGNFNISYRGPSLNVKSDDFDENKDKIIESLKKLAYYFVYDNPRYYWLLNGCSFRTVAGTGTQGIKIHLMGNVSSFGLVNQRKMYETETIKMIDEFTSNISSNSTDLEIVKKAHDFICNRISYHNELGHIDAWAHTIAGCSDSSKLTGSCECYAKTFALLCNGLGVKNLVVTGLAFTGTENGNHAWNYACINNKWYAFDPTWDDFYSSYQYYGLTNSINSDHFPGQNIICYSPLPTLSSTPL